MRSLPCWLLVGLLAACSTDAAPGTTPAAAPGTAVDESAVRDDLAARFAGDRPGPDAEGEGGCFADALLAATSLQELRDGGILDDEDAVVEAFPELERPLAGKVVDAQLGCTDFVDDSSRSGSYVTRERLTRERYVACLRSDLSAATIRAAMLAAVMGEWEDPAVGDLSAVQVRCADRAQR